MTVDNSAIMRPRLAVFPKAFMDELCVSGSMSLRDWIKLAATLPVDGVEFYGGFLDLQDAHEWSVYRELVEEAGLTMPMLCCSPDFCHKDASFRRISVNRQRRWIDMTVALGGQYCRILSGQRRPDVPRDVGVELVAAAFEECLDYAANRQVTLVLENHYKDNYWVYPEFAQHLDVFLELLDRIDHPNFGVNFDPSNAILAGDDPLEWLRHVKHRVVTMHASDRYLKHGAVEDLWREETATGYAARLAHGEIGQGLNDYDAIFTILREEGFDGWISIEDGMDGMEQLARSAAFLRARIRAHWS